MSITVREAATAYEEHAKTLGLSPGYIETNMSYLTRFANLCGQLTISNLDPRYVSKFFGSLPNTRASHNRALSALRGFVKFCERMKYLRPGKADYLLGDRKTKTFTRNPKYYIPISQLGPMLDAAERRHPADRIILALAFYTLARQGEITTLRLKDLDLDNGTIRIYRGKRKRWTVVQICPELWEELDRWLRLYGHEMGEWSYLVMQEDHPDWYLAPGLDCILGRGELGAYDRDLTTYKVNPEKQALRPERLVKRMLDIFGAQTEDGKHVRHLGEGMHTIRRSGARAMIDYLATQYGEDKALLMVSTMLDHETTTMTLLYIGRNLEQKRLNAFLATQSPYGPATGSLGNVTRLPQRSSSVNTIGEVDAL